MSDEKIFLKLKQTRKAFIVEYVCGVFLLGLVLYSLVKQINFPSFALYFIGGLGIFSISIGEISRIFTRYTIMETKLIVVKGLLKQKKKNVYFHPLGFSPDLNIKQSRLQRVFNYGTVYLKGGVENMFELKDIDGPQKVLDLLEDRIDDNRGLKRRNKED